MRKYKEVIEKVIKESVEYMVAPCVECNNDIYAGEKIDSVKDDKGNRIDIELFNHDHGSYFTTGGLCNKCGNTCKQKYEKGGKYKYEAAFIWNNNNDILTLIAHQEVKIKIANDEIIRLAKLKKIKEKKVIPEYLKPSIH